MQESTTLLRFSLKRQVVDNLFLVILQLSTPFANRFSVLRITYKKKYVDLEPNVIDDVKNGSFAAISITEFLVYVKEDAANNFAQGYYTIGKQIINKVNDRLRKLVDNCDNVMCFVIGHSVCGGTGSGPTEVSLLLDNDTIYGICQKQLIIAKPDVDNLNKLISKVISAMTASLRFSGELNVDLN
ncbi:hypothetical protein RFI_35125 [Reticulomyxa filosa]|uniref:Tubulin/FtsZ GTPase domain-containing protein n=1 Tax=Reticulomyxa filosa TaxID=46433 RepID=X6LLS5_RETFI|nr:hypothetical protein RFI_35125 [Reticulomyxa filosa]|eukprot:ETO02311.1 hypothetical protein RFI_35125 [Reticulomyxa filosa]